MDVLNEQLFPLVTAVERVTGRRHHYSTVFRWTRRGLLTPDGRRVRLEFAKCGALPMTSEAAVRRFFTATTVAVECPTTECQTTCQREASLRHAERELREAGV